MNSLEQLKQFSKAVADTGDFQSINKYKPLDATTNPSLIYKAAQVDAYQYIIEEAIAETGIQEFANKEEVEALIDVISVMFGVEILKIVPGRVSTEVNASLSFDTEGSIQKARKLIGLYESKGIKKERILIKIAATWEGIKAAEILEKEGIHTNLTLIFGKAQAIACAEASVTLISPFVGRIFDWYKKRDNVDGYPTAEDPGVLSVTSIYNYFKKFGYNTEIMGASFRNIEQIIELAGCDLITISPKLLEQLSSNDIKVTPKLTENTAKESNEIKINLDEKSFRWLMNEDEMATEKLSAGIRAFNADFLKLMHLLKDKYSA